MEKGKYVWIGAILVLAVVVVAILIVSVYRGPGIGPGFQRGNGYGPGMMYASQGNEPGYWQGQGYCYDGSCSGYGYSNATGYGTGYCYGMMCQGYGYSNTSGNWQGSGPGMMYRGYAYNNGTGYSTGYCNGWMCQGYAYNDSSTQTSSGNTGSGGYAYGYTVTTLLPADNTTPLSPTEIQDILFMREEEQLAHDLYTKWAGLYPFPIFGNIASSETTHIQAVQLLMNRYGLSESLVGNASVGFRNSTIQSLYDRYDLLGNSSVEGAHSSGLGIEIRDITDLDAALQHTSRSDIQQVWTSLRQGSYNHKAAFEMMLGR